MEANFSKELAQALIESEENETEPRLVETSYQRLCFDDPLPVSSAGCLALQRALLDDDQFALSHRFVSGVQQCATQVSRQESRPDAEDPTTPPEESSSFLSPVTSSPSAYAQLAWTVHAYIPLQCFHCTDSERVARYLGSLLLEEQRKESVSAEDEMHLKRLGNTDDFAKEQKEGDGADSLQEIFATESDDSDFEFESGFDDTKELERLHEWAVVMEKACDPLELSRPPPRPTWDMVARSISQLLQALRHSLISSLSAKQWKALRLPDLLTQMTLALLNPSQNASPFFRERPDHHWHNLGVQVLHLFRDGAPEGTAMEGLLDLIHILLQIDAASNSPTSTDISPSTLAGLGSLSALCSDALAERKESLQQRLRSRVLDSCDDLAAVLEKSGNDPTMQWTFLSLFSLFSVPSSVPNSTAQLLLNSGLFRHWLVHWSNTSEDQRGSIQANLLDLCSASPKMLGKYAWRFPGLAETVVAVRGKRVHAMLWNLLGMHLGDTGGGGVQWRSNANKTTANATVLVTIDACRESAWQLFRDLCKSGAQILESWLSSAKEDKEAGSNEKAACTVLNDIATLAECLDKSTVMRKTFLDAEPSSNAANDLLKPLQMLLPQLPTRATSTSSPPCFKVEDELDPTNKPKNTFSERSRALNALRKAVKTLGFVLGASRGDELSSQRAFSSKVD